MLTNREKLLDRAVKTFLQEIKSLYGDDRSIFMKEHFFDKREGWRPSFTHLCMDIRAEFTRLMAEQSASGKIDG